MKKNLIIGCMAVFAVSVQAQEGWTLRQCIDYAIEHNISIRQSANEAKQSAVSVNTAKWARLPNLTIHHVGQWCEPGNSPCPKHWW